MEHRRRILEVTSLAGALAITMVLALTTLAHAQTYKVLHNFTNGNDGATPIAGVTIDGAGNLYGTAYTGGSTGFGTVYRVMSSGSSWTFCLLYNLQGWTWTSLDGSDPRSRVVIGPDGGLYGTTHSGGNGQGCRQLHGCGTVFIVKPKTGNIFGPWQETMLYQFGTYDGSNPDNGDVVFDLAGNLYGTTRNGGVNGQGVVYQLTPNGMGWTETTLHRFQGIPDGATPLSGTVFDQAGNLYGTTSAGGAYGWGTVYQLKPSGSGWTETTLYSFQNGIDGSAPTGGVVLDQSGHLYGATQTGGTGGGGTVFELTLLSNGTWALSNLYEFPTPPLQGSDRSLAMDTVGNLYGTTSGDSAHPWGEVFKLTLSGGSWAYTSLHEFTGGLDGGTPYSSVALDANGDLYGTASAGGAYGFGTVFEITP